MTNKTKTSKFEIIFFKALGSVISLLGLFMYILPVFVELKKDYTKDGWYIPMLVITFGIVVVLYYKKVGSIAVNYVGRKLEDDDEDDEKDKEKDEEKDTI